jgi:hypothetical protein
MAGGRLLFFEFFLMNPDSNIWQTVINSSIADLKAGLMFFSLPSCSRAFSMAASISSRRLDPGGHRRQPSLIAPG